MTQPKPVIPPPPPPQVLLRQYLCHFQSLGVYLRLAFSVCILHFLCLQVSCTSCEPNLTELCGMGVNPGLKMKPLPAIDITPGPCPPVSWRHIYYCPSCVYVCACACVPTVVVVVAVVAAAVAVQPYNNKLIY